ncbi:MAG: NAD(P)H-dependent oxidoreductase [Bacteroidota bacterium]|nr:NAD(P)H-dependent oxidoreductase [Bacteroidota bacterium]
MKYFVIYAHPNPQSFNHAIKETVINALKDAGHEVRVTDLYANHYNPILQPSDFENLSKGTVAIDIKAEQENITWADNIISIYPIWWTGLPAILKGYFDRVFTHGFAFAFNQEGLQKLLAGKKALLISTFGHPYNYYESIGMVDALKKTSDHGIFEFCGVEVLGHKFFGEIASVSDQVREEYLNEVKTFIHKLE